MDNQHFMHTDIMSLPYSFKPIDEQTIGSCACEHRRRMELRVSSPSELLKSTCLAPDLAAVDIGFASTKMTVEKYMEQFAVPMEEEETSEVCRQLAFPVKEKEYYLPETPCKGLRPMPKYDLLDFDVRILFQDEPELEAPGAPIKAARPFSLIDAVEVPVLELPGPTAPGAPRKGPRPFSLIDFVEVPTFDLLGPLTPEAPGAPVKAPRPSQRFEDVVIPRFVLPGPEAPGAPVKKPVSIERKGNPTRLVFDAIKLSRKRKLNA